MTTFRFIAILVLASLFLIVGCTPNVRTYTYYSELEPAWLTPCEIVPPPDREMYLQAKVEERSILMTIAYTQQVEATATCNARFAEMRKYNNRMVEHNRQERLKQENAE